MTDSEQFVNTLEHRAAMASQALTNAAKELFALSRTAEGQDALIEELPRISEASLAVGLAWAEVRKREKA